MDLGLEEERPKMAARDYQIEAIRKVEAGWKDFGRQLLVLATGLGKTICACMLTASVLEKRGKVLFLAHREELIDQAIERFAENGIYADREKAGEYASLDSRVVVASVQTLSRLDRLTGFDPRHFALVIVDEAHRSLSKTHLRVLNYFCFGSNSLIEGWEPPKPGERYERHSNMLGLTATPDRGDSRELGTWYEHKAMDYGILNGVRNGYLVRPIIRNFPIKINLKGISMRGKDLDEMQIAERLHPLLQEIARQYAIEARRRKGIIFTPSIDSARRLAEALRAEGLDAGFVSGNCPDRTEKVHEFKGKGRGSVMVNAMLLLEGTDIRDIDCVLPLRATTIRSVLVQGVGRGLRPLSGVIDFIEATQDRLAAIAASSKPDCLILDPLWLTDRLDLCKAVDLVTSHKELRDKMQEMAEGREETDLLDLEGVANRDLLSSLEKAVRKHSNKSARTIDPLAWAVELGDTDLATYEPETDWDRMAPSAGKLKLLRNFGFNTAMVQYEGQARELVARLMARSRADLASPGQLHLLDQFRVPREDAVKLSKKAAKETIDLIKAQKKHRDEERREVEASLGIL